MTNAEKIATVQTLVESDAEATDAVVSVYLNLARNTMLERLYPLDKTKTVTDIPARYDSIQCELAARYYLRRGGQGEILHSENGVSRTWGSVDDADILERLTPFVKVGGYFAPYKGSNYLEEAELAKNAISTLGFKYDGANEYQLIDANGTNYGLHAIIKYQKINCTDLKYPRLYSQIKKKSL